MKKILKIVSLVGISLVLFFGLVLFAFYYLIKAGEFRRFLISEVEKRTQLKVRVGEAELEMGRVIGISFRDFALIEREKNRPVITAQKILIRVALLPLLERRVVFHEVRFYQPVLQVTRDKQGKISFPNLMVSLPFQEQKEVQFTLDLQEIGVEKGEVNFLDYRQERGPTVTHFREIDLNLRHIQAKELPLSESKVSLRAATRGQEEPQMEFSLKTAIEKDGKRARLTSKGKILFPRDASELRQIWFDLDSHVEDLPASLVWDYYGQFLPVRAVHGTLGSRLHWQGSLARRVQVRGKIDFKRLEVDAPGIFASNVVPGDGRLELEIEFTPQEIRFSRLDLRSKEISLSAQGSMRSLGDKDPYLELNVTTPFLPLLAARKYIPLKTLNSPKWGYLVRAVNQGELRLTKAGVAGRLSEIRRLLEPGFENHIWFDVEVREAGANLTGDAYLPLRGVSGRVVLERGVLYYKGFKGTYGLSSFAEIEGSQKGVLTDHGLLELRVGGEMNLRELREQLKLGLFPAPVGEITAVVQELSGKGKFQISLRKEFSSPYHFEGRLSLEDASLRIGDLSFTEVEGRLSLSPGEIRIEKVTALLAGSPLQAQGTLSQYLSERGSFDLVVESPGIKAGVVTGLLLSAGSPQDPGTVGGTIHYQGSLNSSDGRKLSGSLDLIGVQLSLEPLQSNLQEVSGKVKFDEKGIDFQGIKGQAVGSDFDLSGQWRHSEKPQLTFTLSSPEMDIGYLLSQIEPESSDWYDRVQAKGKVRISKGRYEGFEFSDLETDLKLEKRVWRLSNFFARSEGGTVQGAGSIADYPESVGFSAEPRVQGVPIQGFLGWFDIGTREIAGKVNLTGKIDSSGKTGSER
ncbi:MAG: AsmA family protein, partial [Deltaproteobacteria bacterium]|nr:AsmA family protein [Deltaproteobacteria bacterium]